MAQKLIYYMKIWVAMMADAVLVNVAVYLALYLRFDTPRIPVFYLDPYLRVAPYFTVATVLLLWVTRIYHRLWRYASWRDAQVLILSLFGSSVMLGLALFISRTAHYSRAVYLLYALFAVALLGGWRFLLRSFYDISWSPRSRARERVLIVGAGKAGQLVAEELLRHPEVGLAVGFLDDDMQKVGFQIGPLKVLGTTHDIRTIVRDHQIDQVLLAMPSASGRVIRPLVEECRDLGIKVRILPAINQMIGGQVSVRQIRDVQIEDLLQREPAVIDLGEIAGYITGRVVMVTGAGGTIGSELARQVAPFAPRQLVLLGLDETSIFEIDRDMRLRFPDVPVVPIVADLRDRGRLERIFGAYRPQVIFHAAAHKHVPLMEQQPDEAIDNNVAALWQLADMSHRQGVETFVFISTDKAVNPTSVYGATKRIGELLVRVYASRSSTRFVTVRFGNVLGSRGSVIPIFQQQIAQGGPVTVTHPDMVRYFMTVSEACQLVIQAGAMGSSGEIYVLDMGEPIRILDLATNLIRLSGLRPGVDIDIVFTGIRPGEKLYEELLTAEDETRTTRHERIFVHNEPPVNASDMLGKIETLIRRAADVSRPELMALIQAIVPEYQPALKSRVITAEEGTTRAIRS
ncbi:polysaccharide biosynthesis protein CapD [Sulfobacillus acidophilus TPY]|uniref:Polysaccharide biosynthesis protein CapD n=1 Tax=Sulfobacillus acidophilus (strain ATCC 700253 / DSM 10332 / NAL) TaxID=679936 RepID=G8TTQ9_SULAD|nr:polysaccharide biosynthesis protein CapD [Sulfobacillus acidophilus TPY]AEW06818.1 polysaccharide biosynthesis protein CapD [Sulfobacillus acidophilus DSM 10332]